MNIRNIFIIFFLCICARSYADSGPLSYPSNECFATLEEAAVKALSVAAVNSSLYEHGGGIYEYKGQFCYTLPVTENDKKSVSVTVLKPKGATLVALYHTHPASELSDSCQSFSVEDIRLAKKMNVISFVGFIHDHTIRYYDPNRNFKTENCSSLKRVEVGKFVANLLIGP